MLHHLHSMENHITRLGMDRLQHRNLGQFIGKITEQFLEVIRKGESSPAHCGPYYSIVCWNADKGKTQSKRLKTSEELEQAKRDIENYQRFELLCKAYVQTTQQLSTVERSAAVTTHEKKRKSCSRKIKK